MSNQTDEIRVKRCVSQEFVVEDDAGKQVAILGCSSDGLPFLNLHDDNGMPRLTLSIDPNGSPHVCFQSDDGSIRCAIGESESQEIGCSIYDNDGKPVVTFSVDENGGVSLECGL